MRFSEHLEAIVYITKQQNYSKKDKKEKRNIIKENYKEKKKINVKYK